MLALLKKDMENIKARLKDKSTFEISLLLTRVTLVLLAILSALKHWHSGRHAFPVLPTILLQIAFLLVLILQAVSAFKKHYSTRYIWALVCLADIAFIILLIFHPI